MRKTGLIFRDKGTANKNDIDNIGACIADVHEEIKHSKNVLLDMLDSTMAGMAYSSYLITKKLIKNNFMEESKNTYTNDGLLADLVEKSSEYKRVVKQVEEEVKKIMEEKDIRGMGSCYTFWDEKQRILKEKHGITWRTPTELNPDVIFD